MDESNIDVLTDKAVNKTKVTVLSRQPLGIVSSEAKLLERVQASVSDNEEESAPDWFIVKTFLSTQTRDISLEHYRFLQRHGFPIPEVSLPIENDQLLISDLSENGEKIVYSLNPTQEDDKSIVLANRDELKRQLREIASKAETLGVRISADAPFMVLDSNGKGQIVIGDFGAGVFISEKELAQESGYKDARTAMVGFWDNVNSFFTEGTNIPINDPLYPETER